MGFTKKSEALLAIHPDIAIVPECSEKSIAQFRQVGWNTHWVGANPNKGIGVISRFRLRALPLPGQLWIVPLEVEAPVPFTLIAVWAYAAAGTKRTDRYIGQVYQALMAHPEWLAEKPVVIAGDFNSNKLWDYKRKVGNHSDVVELLRGHSLVSAYHEHRKEAQGAETMPTFYRYRHHSKPYHIDYVFIPEAWLDRLRTVDVGTYEEWTQFSDHCPIVVEIAVTL